MVIQPDMPTVGFTFLDTKDSCLAKGPTNHVWSQPLIPLTLSLVESEVHAKVLQKLIKGS